MSSRLHCYFWAASRVRGLFLAFVLGLALFFGLWREAYSQGQQSMALEPRLAGLPELQVQAGGMEVYYKDSSEDVRHTNSVAWGDVDGDGDLDLAVGNGIIAGFENPNTTNHYNLVNQLYVNEGNGRFTPTDIYTHAYHTRDVAWGDWDGDGDLDLAVANGNPDSRGEPNQIYENEAGTLLLDPENGYGWIITDSLASSSVAWGDWDGDGDLDLAVGNDGDERSETGELIKDHYANQVYENMNGTLKLAWQSAFENSFAVKDVAWGDWDNDGDLDLAAGNYGNGDQVFENVNGSLQIDPANDVGWQFEDQEYIDDGCKTAYQMNTQSIAWGDWDNDGDLDLAVGGGADDNACDAFLLVHENSGGTLLLDADHGWQSKPDEQRFKAFSLDWGDWDGDGDLDLAVGHNAGGGWGKENRIYENEGQKLVVDPARGLGWQSAIEPNLNAETTFSVAFGDADGDGDLDLAVGNGGIESDGQENIIFKNQNPAVSVMPQPWSSVDAKRSTSVAWGDVDGDGDLDLAVGNYGEPNQVYVNQGGVLQFDQQAEPPLGWEADEILDDPTTSVAWGDWDGDGDLDLAVGNEGTPNLVYENLNNTLQKAWEFPSSSNTQSVAWGDWDRDGDLDLAVANCGGTEDAPVPETNTVWNNEDGVLTVGWQSAEPICAYSAAWGDWDDDGDLDLALGARVYENVGRKLVLDERRGLGWDSGTQVHGVAWGDYDGDGDLDLAVATWAKNVVYENTGGYLVHAPRADRGWSSFDNKRSQDVAWGDLDNDGDLDLVVANAANFGYEPNQVYENENGRLAINASWVTPNQRQVDGLIYKSRDVALGDMDNDGDLDLAFANSCTGGGNCDSEGRQNHVYQNVVQGVTAVTATLPSATIIEPYAGASADFYASPDILSNAAIPIQYILQNPHETPMGRVDVYFSLNGGDEWQVAKPVSGTQTTNLATSVAGTAHEFVWDTFGSDFFGYSDDVVVRLVAYPLPSAGNPVTPGTYAYFNQAPDAQQRPFFSDTSFPFRVQSTQIHVTGPDGKDAEGALVYRLPGGQVVGAEMMPNAERPLPTDIAGLIPGGGTLRQGDKLVALLPIPVTDVITFTDRARLFYTSAAPTTNGLAMQEFKKPGVIDLKVSPENPLLLFDLVVSIEWDASDDVTFMNELHSGFQRASEILFDTSNGQMALGTVHVYHNKQGPDRSGWEGADIQILANNSIRPSAAYGGVVSTTLAETTFVDGVEKIVNDAYSPQGKIRMGPAWDPFGENTADLSQAWWQALAHELSHYLLFLPDNYLGFKGENNEALGRINCQYSFMTTTYDPAYTEFLNREQWQKDPDCLHSLAQETTGRSDWETISHFYPMLNIPASGANAALDNNFFEGPNLLPLNLMNFITYLPIDNRTVLPTRFLDVRDGENERARLPAAQGYLIQTQGTENPTDDMLISLGNPTGGGDRFKLRGAYPGDKLCLLNHDRLGVYAGCAADLSEATVRINVSPPDTVAPPWQPEIAVELQTPTQVQVTVRQAINEGEKLTVQIFPAHYFSVPCFTGLSPTATMTATGDTHTAVLDMRLPDFEMLVRVSVDGDESRQVVSYFLLDLPEPAPGEEDETFESRPEFDDPTCDPAAGTVLGRTPVILAGPNIGAVGGPNIGAVGGPNIGAVGGPNIGAVGGPNIGAVGGPNIGAVGGPNIGAVGGPNIGAVGGPNIGAVGGPNIGAVGGPNIGAVGGPNIGAVGGANNRQFSAPIASADAQVVIYNAAGFFEENGVKQMDVLAQPPGLQAEPWLTPVGQAYHVALDDAEARRIIAYTYLQRDVPEGYEHTLAIYFLPDEADARWQKIESERYVENLVVAELMPEDGTYAVMAAVDMPALTEGWNLIAYPLPVSRPVTESLVSIADVLTAVYPANYDSQTNSITPPTDVACPDASGEIQVGAGAEQLEFSKLYWLCVREDVAGPLQFATPIRGVDGELE